MWSSWAFCKLVHISMLTPHLSIKMLDNRNISHHIMGQRAARQFGDGMLENFKISSILLHIGPFLRISALSQPRLAWVVKSCLSRCVTIAQLTDKSATLEQQVKELSERVTKSESALLSAVEKLSIAEDHHQQLLAAAEQRAAKADEMMTAFKMAKEPKERKERIPKAAKIEQQETQIEIVSQPAEEAAANP